MTSSLSTFELDFAERFPVSFAQSLSLRDADAQHQVLALLGPDLMCRVAAELPPARLVQLAPLLFTSERLTRANTDIVLNLINRLPRELALQLVHGVEEQRKRRTLLQFLNFPRHTLGAKVEKPSQLLSASDSLEAVVDELSHQLHEPTIVVVGERGEYLGVVESWRLIGHDNPSTTPKDVMVFVTPLIAESDAEQALAANAWNRRTWLPVVDRHRIVIGICWRDRLVKSAPKSVLGDHGGSFFDLFSACITLAGRALSAVLGAPK